MVATGTSCCDKKLGKLRFNNQGSLGEARDAEGDRPPIFEDFEVADGEAEIISS